MIFGKITSETSAQYHASAATSCSKLRTFLRRPAGAALYKQTYLDKTVEDSDSPARQLGRALHTLCLEGAEAYAQQFIVTPENAPARPTDAMINAEKPSDSSKYRVAYWKAFEERCAGKELISSAMHAKAAALADGVWANPTAAKLLIGGESEVTWRVKGAGAFKHIPAIQCRSDKYNANGCEISGGRPFFVDVKTTESLAEEGWQTFEKSCKKLRYDLQAGAYMEVANVILPTGQEVHDFFFIAVEKEAPFGIKICKLSQASIEKGQRDFMNALTALNECYATGIWPNIPLDIQEIDTTEKEYYE